MTTDLYTDDDYSYFLSEAQDLLRNIEQDLLSLREDRSLVKVHRLMRLAHTLKGAATAMEKSAIAQVAHVLEDIFTALYKPEIVIDADVESLLFQGYECLRLLLTAEFSGKPVDESDVLNRIASVIAQLQKKLGDCFNHDAPLPTSTDLGFDVVQSMFEVGVTQQLKRLRASLANSPPEEFIQEFQSEVEVFLGLAESLKLPGFEAIARITLTALAAKPSQVVRIAEFALDDFEQGRAAVLAGDRDHGGAPSLALRALTKILTTASPPTTTPLSPSTATDASVSASATAAAWQPEEGEAMAYVAPEQPLALDASIHTAALASEPSTMTEAVSTDVADDSLTAESEPGAVLFEEQAAVNTNVSTEQGLSLDDLFGTSTLPSESMTETTLTDDAVDTVGESTDYLTADLFDDAESVTGLEQGDAIDSQLTPASRNAQPTEEILSLDDLLTANVEAEPHAPNLDPQAASPVVGAVLSNHNHQAAQTTPNERLETVRVGVEPLKRLDHLAGELLTNQNKQTNQDKQLRLTMLELRSHIQQHQQTVHRLQDALNRLLIGLESGKVPVSAAPLVSVFATESSSPWIHTDAHALATTFDPLEMDRYSDLHSLIQSVLNETVQLDVTTEVVDQLVKHGGQTLQTQQRLMTQLRDDLTSVRLQPLQYLLNRFPRVLHQLAETHHKDAELNLKGTQVLVDKAIAEKLYDPLLHLVRNAFDHGLESADVRQRQGKPRVGQIDIRAYQQAGQTVIEVKDDGQGVDVQRVIQRAIGLNIATPEQVRAMSESQLLTLLFEPGFSTAAHLSQLSGRGMGLDIVKSQLQAVQGSVEISSIPQKGTTFYLRVPLSVTIAKLLVCRSQEMAYVLSVEQVEQIIVPRPDQLTSFGGTQVVLCWKQGNEERMVPVHHLSDLVEYSSTSSQLSSVFSGASLESGATPQLPPRKIGKSPILVLQTAAGYKGLAVDQVLGEQDLVIRSMGDAIAPPTYAYGCSILSDGQLALAIDVDLLLQPKPESPSPAQPSLPLGLPPIPSQFSLPSSPDLDLAPPKPKSLPIQLSATIMVVDDSLTLRQTLSKALRKAGFRIRQAEDGLDALTQLQQHSPSDLIVCDIEMPRLDGYQFLHRLRQYPALAQIPVICLTSRHSQKHRQLALKLGAADYFTKPYNADELIASIHRLLHQESK